MYPSKFGRPEEDINCRCTINQRARWALDDDELETLKQRAEKHGLYIKDEDKDDFLKAKEMDFDEFLKKYPKITEEELKLPSFVPATDIKEAEEYIKKYVDDGIFGATGVSYNGISIESANAINKALTKLFEEYNIGKLGGIIAPKGNTKLGKLIANAKAAYSPIRKSLLLNSKTLKNLKTLAKEIEEEKRLVFEYLKNPKSFTFRTKRAEAVMKASAISGRATVPETIEDIINHEFGHTFEKAISQMDNYDLIKANMPKYAEKISGYATTDIGEYIAESFASYRKGEKLIDPELEKVFEKLKKNKVIPDGTSTKNIEKIGNGSIIVSDKQFGKKVGKHAKDYDLDASKETDREKMREIIDDIVVNHTDVLVGSWKGQSEECYFWIKGSDVVVSTVESKRFVTIMKGRMEHEGLKKARRIKI